MRDWKKSIASMPNLLWSIYKIMFEFKILILTYWVGNLSVVALDNANVITNVEFYLIWGLVLFTFFSITTLL